MKTPGRLGVLVLVLLGSLLWSQEAGGASSIHGFKFEDVDGDGVYSDGIDRPLAGVTFTLTGTDGLGNVVNLAETTDVNGEFAFTGLLPSVNGAGPATGYTVTETVPAGQVATTPTTYSTDLPDARKLVAFSGQAGSAPLVSTTIDFDGPDASGGPITGAAVADYLDSFGITIDNITPSGGMQIVDDRVGFPSQVLRAFSDFNVLWHDSPNNPYSYQVNFAVEQDSFEFVRPELFGATPSGLIVSPWRARAFDSSGGLLDTVSEPQLAFFGSSPAVPSALNGPGIAYVIFDRTTVNTIAGLNRVPTDEWTIDVPDWTEVLVGEPLMFGNAALGSIHGFKFVDADGDGVYNPAVDEPLAGVGFTLTGTDGQGNVISLPTTTGANGEFHYTNMLPSVNGAGPGTGYTVTENLPAGFSSTTPTAFTTDLYSGEELVAFPGQAGLPAPVPAILNFDDVDASGGPLTGTALAAHLYQNGITIDNITPSGGMQIVDDRFGFPSQVLRAPSDFNVLWHDSPNDPYSYRVNFAVEQDSFGFVRPELFGATPSGLIVSPWRARAFDSSGGLLDTVSEPQLAFFGSTPAVPFTLNGPGIAYVIFDRTTPNTIAGLNRVPTDDWTLDVPADGRREILLGGPLMFGNPPGSIHGFKFEDVDGDGVYSAGTDHPSAGVTFTLTGTDGLGNVVNLADTTDVNGEFAFTGLLPSVNGAGPATGYTVTETVPAGQFPTSPTSYVTDLRGGRELVAFPGQAGLPAPVPAILNFDDVDASGGPLTGLPLVGYLYQNGVTIDNITPGGGMQIVDDRFGFPSQVLRASSDFNVLWHDSPNDPYSYRVNFAVEQASFGFVRPELFGATPSGLIVSPWRARAFDSSGGLLDMVSEPQLAFFGSTPAVPFTLNGPGIAYVIFDRTTQNTIAGLNRLPTDDWAIDVPADARREVLVGGSLMFGNCVLGSIHGLKFMDWDGDGNYDPAIDRPLVGTTVTLTGTDGQGNVINLSTTTDANGEFHYTNMLPSVNGAGPGTGYTITETGAAGYSSTTPVAYTTDLYSGEELVSRPGQAGLPAPVPTVVNFDNVDASGGPLTGAALAAHLYQNGITIDNITPSGGMQIVDDRFGFPSQVLRASSVFNVLWHDSPNDPYSYQVNFAVEQDSFEFMRPELFGATPSGLIVSPWRARAFDSSGGLLDTVSEPQLAFFGSTPAVPFTLNGPGIAYVIFDRTTPNTIAGLNRVPTDDWTLDVPADGRREILLGGPLMFGNAPVVTLSPPRVVSGNMLEVTVSSPEDGTYEIEESENLVDWNPLTTGAVTGGTVIVPLGLIDPAQDRRFFRGLPQVE